MPRDDTDQLLRRLLAQRLVQPVRLGRLRCWLLTPAAQDRLTELVDAEEESVPFGKGADEASGSGWSRGPQALVAQRAGGSQATGARAGTEGPGRAMLAGQEGTVPTSSLSPPWGTSRPAGRGRRAAGSAAPARGAVAADPDDLDATRTLTLSLPEPIVAPPRRRRRLIPPLALAAGALAVVGVLVAGATGQLSTGRHAARRLGEGGHTVPSLVSITGEGPATGRYAVALSSAVVTVAADAPCWVAVSATPGGTPVFQGLLQGGETKAFKLSGSLVVDVGSSGCRLGVAGAGRSAGPLAPPVAPYEFRFVTTGA